MQRTAKWIGERSSATSLGAVILVTTAFAWASPPASSADVRIDLPESDQWQRFEPAASERPLPETVAGEGGMRYRVSALPRRAGREAIRLTWSRPQAVAASSGGAAGVPHRPAAQLLEVRSAERSVADDPLAGDDVSVAGDEVVAFRARAHAPQVVPEPLTGLSRGGEVPAPIGAALADPAAASLPIPSAELTAMWEEVVAPNRLGRAGSAPAEVDGGGRLAELAVRDRPAVGLTATTEISRYARTARGIEFQVPARVNGTEAGKVALLIADKQNISIELGALLSLLEPLIDKPQFDALSGSRAAGEYVTLNALRAAGVEVAFDKHDRLVLGSARR